MRLAYFDCPSGAAGDMILGACVDAGAPFEALRAELRKLALPGWDLRLTEVRRGAFRAAKVDVDIDGGRHHHHRNLGDIVAILRGSTLAPVLVERAERIFTRLADAEAKVHGTTREAVRFHDVGAVDAIVDITGSVVAFDLLGVEAVAVSPLPVGGGAVEGAHGRMPLPAPGTAELLRGFPVFDSGVRREILTPTGAAILTTLGRAAERMPAMTIGAVGYGAGTWDPPDTANVLRVFVGEAAAEEAAETIAQVETTIDDMSPQLYEPLLDRLLEAGAVDVFLTPVVMKRSRPGTVLTALCPPARLDAVRRVLFEESTTIGVRWSERRRTVLPRETVSLVTPDGPLRVKVSRLGDRVVTVTPEFADVVRIARDKGLPVREVLERARTEAARVLGR